MKVEKKLSNKWKRNITFFLNLQCVLFNNFSLSKIPFFLNEMFFYDILMMKNTTVFLLLYKARHLKDVAVSYYHHIVSLY